MTLLEFMEDFDNWELSTQDRKEQLMDAVVEYNEKYGTDYNTSAKYLIYEQKRKEQDQ